jgi:hypothetical protein
MSDSGEPLTVQSARRTAEKLFAEGKITAEQRDGIVQRAIEVAARKVARE